MRRPVCQGGVTLFHPECIGPAPLTDEGGRHFDTLETQLARGAGADRVVVKMDVEGAEWETLLRAPSATLERIDQLVVELHGVAQEQHLAVVRRLKEFFHVANLHFNNFACAERLDPFPASVYEVLFVNRRLATTGPQRANGPHPLDAPTVRRGPTARSQRPDGLTRCRAHYASWVAEHFLKHV